MKPGDRVRLVSHADPDSDLTPGTEGTVSGIDGFGTVHVQWDTGSQLGMVPETDRWVHVESGLSDSTQRIYDNAETAIAAIEDFERLLSGDDCPLPEWLTSKYTLRCKSMITELQRMSDEWAAKS